MEKNRVPTGFTAVLLTATITLTACASLSSGTAWRPRVALVDLPKGLVLPEDQAIAYRAVGRPGKVVRGAEFSTRPLLARGVKAPAGFQIYEQSRGNYHAIAYQQRGDRLVADVVAGRTYLIAPAYTDHLGTSLTALCRLTIKLPRPAVADVPRICTQILCAQQRFTAGSLVETFGPLPEGMPPSLQLGGWNPIPRDWCATCTRPRGAPPDDELTLSFVCPTPPQPACEGGQSLFNADFEADVVGSAPAASPPGPPPGDAVTVSGDVTVVNASSRAVRVKRGNLPAEFRGILAAGATGSGSYCVKFTGQAAVSTFSPAVMTFNAANGARAWQLVINDDQVELVGGGGRFVLVQDFSVPRSFRFDVDLDVRRFDMFVDGTRVASNVQFLDATFDVPADLRFQTGQCILECFPAEYTVDDVRVTKTE